MVDLNDVTEWARQTFGTATPTRAAVRANEEMAELLKAACADWRERDKIMEEAADVVIVLCHLAGSLDEDLGRAIEKKMAKNRLRTWRLDGDGAGYHVAAGPAQ